MSENKSKELLSDLTTARIVWNSLCSKMTDDVSVCASLCLHVCEWISERRMDRKMLLTNSFVWNCARKEFVSQSVICHSNEESQHSCIHFCSLHLHLNLPLRLTSARLYTRVLFNRFPQIIYRDLTLWAVPEYLGKWLLRLSGTRVANRNTFPPIQNKDILNLCPKDGRNSIIF